MSVALANHFTLTLVGVVPILPTLGHLFWLIPALTVAAITALWGLRSWHNGSMLLAVLWRLKWQILCSVAGALLLWGCLQAGYQSWKPAAQSPAVEETDSDGMQWPLARGGLRRQGSLPGREPVNADVVWNCRRGSEAFYASPAIVDDRLYIVGSRGDTGRVYCLDCQGGDILWSCSPSGYAATLSSPVIAKGRLVVGEGLHHTKAGRVICLDLREGREGRVRWMFRTASHVECTPVIHDDRVYVNAGDDGVYCLALAPTGRQGEVLWHVPGEIVPDAETALAVDEGIVYVGLGVGGQALCAIDALTGEIQSRQEIPYPAFSVPAIVSGRLYVGMGLGDVVAPNDARAGQLGCFTLPSLEPIWSRQLPGTVMGAITVTDDGVICGCSDGQVYRFSLQGKAEAQHATSAPIVGSVAVTKRYSYAVNQAGVLWCLNLPDLTPCWSKTIGAPGYYTSSPVSAYGHLYVGTDRDGVFCIGSANPQSWSSPRGGAGAVGCPDASRVGAQGHVQSVSQFDAAVTPLAATDQALVVASGSDAARDLICLQIKSEKGKQRPVRKWKVSARAGDVAACAIAERNQTAARCLVMRRGTVAGAELQCLDLNTGQLRWTEDLHGTVGDWITTDGDWVFVQPVAGALRCMSVDGQTIWEREVGDVTHAIACDTSRIAVATTKPHALVLLDKLTGRELWRCKLAAQPTAAPVIHKDIVAVGTAEGLRLRSLLDGDLRWQSTNGQGGVASEIGITGNRLFWRTTKSRIVGLQVPEHRQWMAVDVDAAAAEMIRADDGVLLLGRQHIKKISRQGDGVTVWSELPAEDKACGGLLRDGRLWIGTSEGKLLGLGSEATP